MIVIIDNYDSFTYNLYQLVHATAGAETRVEVLRNDAVGATSVRERGPTHVVLSPGPGHPADSRLSLEVAQALPGVPPLPPAGVPSELVSRRPDLVSAERKMWAAGARWTQARRSLYPSFSLRGSLGTSTSDFLQVFNGNFFTWNSGGR